MDFPPQTKAWIQLIALIFGTGAGITVTSYLGGSKLWVSVLCGLGAAGMGVFHALSDSPKDKIENKPTP